MTDESTDAPAPTRRSVQAARPVPPPLPDVAPEPAAHPVVAPLPVTAASPDDTPPDPEGPARGAEVAPTLAWAPPAPRRPPSLSGWALAVAIVGLIVSCVVGWGFPVGIIAIITAIAALRRPGRHQAAAWALGLGILSILYSALWIAVAVTSGRLF